MGSHEPMEHMVREPLIIIIKMVIIMQVTAIIIHVRIIIMSGMVILSQSSFHFQPFLHQNLLTEYSE